MPTAAPQSPFVQDEPLPVLCWENWLRASDGASVSASSTAALSGDDFTDMSAGALLTGDLDTAWRSGSLSASPGVVTILFKLGRPKSVDWVSIHRHNVLVPWRVELFRADPALGVAAVYDSGWVDTVVRANLADFRRFDRLIFTLGPDPDRLAVAATLCRLDSFVAAPSPVYGVAWIRVSFDGSAGANGDADALTVSHPLAGLRFVPKIGPTLGWAITPVDRSDAKRVDSGLKRGRRKSMGRQLAFTLGYLDRYDAFRRLLSDLAMGQGTLGLVFAWKEPSRRAWYYDQAILGQLETLPVVSMDHLDVPAAKSFTLEEAG